MADRILKSLTFPDLPDKYLIPQGTVTEADLAESEGKKADAIVRSASGDIASYDDGGDLPMKSLKVNIVPKQSGTGDPSPSNVRPISGTDTVNAYRKGKNLLKSNLATKTKNGVTITVNDDGSMNLNGTCTGWFFETLNYVDANTSFLPEGNYIFSGGATGCSFMVYADGTKQTTISSNAETSFSMPENNASWVRLEINNGTVLNNVNVYPMIRPSALTDSTFAPYQGESKSISLPQTVYGGTLDVVSGKLIITHALLDMGNYNYSHTALSNNRHIFSVSMTGMKPSSSNGEKPNIIASMYIPGSYNDSWANGMVVFSASAPTVNIGFVNNAYSDASAFKTAMTGQKFTVPLAYPTEIDLTPTEVKSLLGDNNVWSDSGTVEVEYRADTSLVINKILEALEP